MKLGKFQTDETGDLATVQGLRAYSDRVFRRLSTRKDKFGHLPGYGTLFAAYSKQLARTGVKELLALDAEEQIRQEPETTSVSVIVRQDPNHPEVAYYDVFANAGILTLKQTYTIGDKR